MRRHAVWGATAVSVVMAVLGASTAHAEGEGDIRVVKGVTNGGKSVVVGIDQPVTFRSTLTVKDDSGVKGLSRAQAFHRTSTSGAPVETVDISCKKLSTTTSACTATMRIDPAWFPSYNENRNANEAAGSWGMYGIANANDGDYWIYDGLAPFAFKRAATLTASAARASRFGTGRQVTVTGALARADWEALKYRGYAGQGLKLQFKKAGSSSYTTVRTVTTNSAGRVSATVTAPGSGRWRWFYQGTSTTMQVASQGDEVFVGTTALRSTPPPPVIRSAPVE
ncbi:hypothetical protein ACWCXC_19690 [Streptomyces sp. NPDC001515]